MRWVMHWVRYFMKRKERRQIHLRLERHIAPFRAEYRLQP
jgi:hypothetical protein